VWSRARADGDTTRASVAAGVIGAIVAIAAAGLFLGVLERVIEILLWGLPAIAISWPRAPGAGVPVERSQPAMARAHTE
jgi:hypothetical protein